MVLLAEISDKMTSIGQMWLLAVFLSCPAIIAINRKLLSFIILLALGVLSTSLAYMAYHQAFAEPGFSELVHQEMGVFWIFNSIASSLVPLFFVILVFSFNKFTAKRKII